MPSFSTAKGKSSLILRKCVKRSKQKQTGSLDRTKASLQYPSTWESTPLTVGHTVHTLMNMSVLWISVKHMCSFIDSKYIKIKICEKAIFHVGTRQMMPQGQKLTDIPIPHISLRHINPLFLSLQSWIWLWWTCLEWPKCRWAISQLILSSRSGKCSCSLLQRRTVYCWPSLLPTQTLPTLMLSRLPRKLTLKVWNTVFNPYQSISHF